MPAQTKSVPTAESLEHTRIPVRDVRAIVTERVTVTRKQLCDEFHTILKKIESTVTDFKDDVYLSDSEGKTVSYGQLYAILNNLQTVIGEGQDHVKKLQNRQT